MRALAAAGAGFLIAVLWFDLMFDAQTAGHGGGDLPPAVRASISAYYARVTTTARPMNRLVAAVMLTTLVALGSEIARHDVPVGRAVAAFVLALAAIALAAVRTVPHAVRLGRAVDDPSGQSRLARGIARDHVVCIVAVSAALVVQLLPV